MTKLKRKGKKNFVHDHEEGGDHDKVIEERLQQVGINQENERDLCGQTSLFDN